MHKFDTKIATYSILSKLIEMQPEYKKSRKRAYKGVLEKLEKLEKPSDPVFSKFLVYKTSQLVV